MRRRDRDGLGAAACLGRHGEAWWPSASPPPPWAGTDPTGDMATVWHTLACCKRSKQQQRGRRARCGEAMIARVAGRHGCCADGIEKKQGRRGRANQPLFSIELPIFLLATHFVLLAEVPVPCSG